MQSIMIRGPKIYTESGIITDAGLMIKHGKINKILSAHEMIPSAEIDSLCFKFPDDYSIVPGRIDLHTHGIAGVDVMDATPQALSIMAQTLAKEGTTSFLATTMSMPVSMITAAIKNVADFMQNKNNSGARILGLHLEGPFIAASKMGAHVQNDLLIPDVTLIQHWQGLALGGIKLMTLAPELAGADILIAALLKLGIIAAIGHSNASYARACTAIDQGCRHITHLFNAMSGLHHRSPGVVLAALERPILAEIIADGEHVSWDMLRFVMRIKGKHQLCVVTDGMRAKCMPVGEYNLGGQKVYVTQENARLANGTLAGSILTMTQAVKNLIEQDICDLNETIFLSAINPAKQLGIFDTVGSITPGKWADLIVLDQHHAVIMTLCRGQIAYNAA